MKYVVEHLEEELYEWCVLEYAHMLEKVGKGNLILTNLSENIVIPRELDGIIVTSMRAEDYTKGKSVILLDQCAKSCLTQTDSSFDYILCGGILGTDEFDGPMVDRTENIRMNSFESRHLGPRQMTADTAIIVSKLIIEDGKELNQLEFIDRPSIKIAKKEYVEMPFRYLVHPNGEPIIPPGMLEYLIRNNDMSFD